MTNIPDPGPTPQPSRPAEDWWWQLEDADGAVVAGESPTFPSQGDAESWLGESWRELREGGARAVRLFEGDREVYGPMGLDA